VPATSGADTAGEFAAGVATRDGAMFDGSVLEVPDRQPAADKMTTPSKLKVFDA
jgi:hypothetical protein